MADASAPPGDRPPATPATVAAQEEDGARLRRLRAWAVAATVLALLAAGVAVLALFTDDIDEREKTASERDVTQLSERTDALEDRIESLTRDQSEQAADVSRITTRLDEIEVTVSDLRSATREAPEEVQSLSTQVDDLETRLEDLESSSGGGTAGGPASGP